jgi:methyl-accepting chemotaxis protein
MDDISGKISQIAGGSQEQSRGLEQINQAILELEEAVNQNVALADQLSDANKSMNMNTTDLNRQVGKFKINN